MQLPGENLPPVYVLGAPGPVGGADTELWHTLRLWRGHGLPVHVVPTRGIDPSWQGKCEAIGCTVHGLPSPDALLDVPGLAGSIVVGFCNSVFLAQAGRLRKAGCRLVWVNCMTWLFEAERRHYRQHGPFDHYVFQSRYQQETLVPQLRAFGYRDEQGSLIRGPMMLDEFPFQPRPHASGEPFIIGRISRADRDKFSANTWPIYRRIPHPVRARVMAWSEPVARKLGPPPAWAECLPAGAQRREEFFATLHAMMQVNGGAGENWPRSGLEAMATGVPVVAPDQWGWHEMIRHGETGYLAKSEDELAYYAARLAYDEEQRLRMAREARRSLETDLADPERILAGWHGVFDHVG